MSKNKFQKLTIKIYSKNNKAFKQVIKYENII